MSLPNADTTALWVQGITGAGKPIRPGLALMVATDTNWIFHHDAAISNYYRSDPSVNNAAMMNCGTQGMRFPGITNWAVQESIDTVTNTATVEMMNALPISQIETTLTSSLPARYHSSTVTTHWWDSPANGHLEPVEASKLQNNEDRIVYREFEHETITVSDISQFPDPRVPLSEAVDTLMWPASSTGVGSYFLQIGNEIVRVTNYNTSTNTFTIPAGGRGVSGFIEAHSPGEKVTLLGFGPFTGKWTGYGYLTTDEANPQRSMMRPGTCLVSYEGFGDFDSNALVKQPWAPGCGRNYEFTGYWFVKGQDTTLSEDGVPKVSFELASAGYILEQQKITEDSLRDLKINSAKGGDEWEQFFDKVNHKRNIPRDWVDFHNWDPNAEGAVPLQIKTEFAQHKAFFEHMQSSNFGKKCERCNEEYQRYVQELINKKKKIGENPIADAKANGKHVYKESIRVYDSGKSAFEPGPLHTYGRLMLELGKRSWEMPNLHSPVGNQANATRWTKLPAQLWDNMRQFQGTGLCWNSTLTFMPVDSKGKEIEKAGERNEQGYFQAKLTNGEYSGEHWGNVLIDGKDRDARFTVEPLMCPFESTYDKQPWYQPLLDLADINRMTFVFTRQGFPVFAPRGMNLRGVSHQTGYEGRDDDPGTIFNPNPISSTNYPRPGGSPGEWWLSWGKSISSYNFNYKPESVLTKAYVSGTDAFGGQFTVQASGTGLRRDGALVWYSSKTGNRDALQLTGGVQHVDTMSLENLILGLDWSTNPANWSLVLDRKGEYVYMTRFPSIPVMKSGDYLNKKTTKQNIAFKKLFNFLRLRLYINAVFYEPKKIYIQTLTEDGKYNEQVEACIKAVQRFIRGRPQDEFTNTEGYNYAQKVKVDGKWGRAETKAIIDWAKKNETTIKKDVWWYAIGGYNWDYYVAAVTGLYVPQRKLVSSGNNKKGDPQWETDALALRKRISKWQFTFFKQAVNLGNQAVEESINKATVRTISANIADPRICVGDVIYANIPGHISQLNEFGQTKAGVNPNSTGATYVTQLSRTMDLQSGSYTASYSGYRYRSSFTLLQTAKLKDYYWGY